MAPAGPLDRWLRRAPLEPLQRQAAAPEIREPCDQQTAEPPSSNEQQEQRAPGATLQAYFTSASHEADAIVEAPRKRRRPPGREPLDWQLTGTMSSGAEALLHHRQAACYRQAAFLETHSWQRPILGGRPHSSSRGGSIQSATFDSQGELLAAISDDGILTVHSLAALQAVAGGCCAATGGPAALPPPAAQPIGIADPLLVLDTRMAKLQAVRWNPADENVVGLVSAATRQLVLYDLLHTQGQPKQVLSIPQQSASAGLSGSTAVGLSDLAFFGGASSSSSSGGGGNGSGGGYVVLASGMGGQVFLWDCRAKSAPSAMLLAASGQGQGAAYAVQLSPDQQVVMAGMQSGEVKLWDLRGGSCSTLRFGGSVHHHPLLASVNLRYALTAVPGLARQTAIPASAVHSMQLDPCDPRRLGFHLGCGWSGVLDLGLSGGTVTHLHAPAHGHSQPENAAGGAEGGAPAAGMFGVEQFQMAATGAAPMLQRRACWARDGRRYCVPSRREDALLLLDFAAAPAAGCYVLGEDEEEAAAGEGYDQGGSSRQRQQWAPPRAPPGVHLPLSQGAVCAAAHPTQDLLVAGSVESCLSVAGIF